MKQEYGSFCIGNVDSPALQSFGAVYIFDCIRLRGCFHIHRPWVIDSCEQGPEFLSYREIFRICRSRRSGIRKMREPVGMEESDEVNQKETNKKRLGNPFEDLFSL